MCGIFMDPNEIARALTIAAAPKVVVNQAGMSVEESNIELGRQMAVVYKTILRELSGGDTHEHEHAHDSGVVHSHAHEHTHGDSSHSHDHSHGHEHGHPHDHGEHTHSHAHDHNHAH